ncbi:MAG: hypothetical protein K2O91_04980 [Lachnospiraceae bacterium]|nr:hypothetical protein [Lachnospiraceae bacterium]
MRRSVQELAAIYQNNLFAAAVAYAVVVVGGVSFDENGNATWLSADEVAAHMSESADVKQDEEGKVWVYYYDQKIEITDSFDENGICNLTLTHEDKTIYLEITSNGNGGYLLSQTENPSADSSYKYGSKSGYFTQPENIPDSGKEMFRNMKIL